jgi:hypothetical protein
MLQHMRYLMLHTEKYAFQIDVDKLVELLPAPFVQRLVGARYSGIVERAVNPAKPGDGTVHDLGDVGLTRNVGLHQFNVGIAGSLDLFH